MTYNTRTRGFVIQLFLQTILNLSIIAPTDTLSPEPRQISSKEKESFCDNPRIMRWLYNDSGRGLALGSLNQGEWPVK